MVLLQVHHRLEESTEELQYNHLKQSYHSRKESRYLRYLCVPDDEFDICQIIECSTLNHLLTNHFLRDWKWSFLLTTLPLRKYFTEFLTFGKDMGKEVR